jgi:hypothetical protein
MHFALLQGCQDKDASQPSKLQSLAQNSIAKPCSGAKKYLSTGGATDPFAIILHTINKTSIQVVAGKPSSLAAPNPGENRLVALKFLSKGGLQKPATKNVQKRLLVASKTLFLNLNNLSICQ